MQVFDHAGASISAGQPHNSRACKYVLNLVAGVFNIPALASAVTESPLKKTVSTVRGEEKEGNEQRRKGRNG